MALTTANDVHRHRVHCSTDNFPSHPPDNTSTEGKRKEAEIAVFALRLGEENTHNSQDTKVSK